MRELLHSRRYPGLLHLALVCALLFASALDLAHAHASGTDEATCYGCHFSGESQVGPRASLPQREWRRAEVLSCDASASPIAASTSPFEARGPPLLT